MQGGGASPGVGPRDASPATCEREGTVVHVWQACCMCEGSDQDAGPGASAVAELGFRPPLRDLRLVLDLSAPRLPCLQSGDVIAHAHREAPRPALATWGASRRGAEGGAHGQMCAQQDGRRRARAARAPGRPRCRLLSSAAKPRVAFRPGPGCCALLPFPHPFWDPGARSKASGAAPGPAGCRPCAGAVAGARGRPAGPHPAKAAVCESPPSCVLTAVTFICIFIVFLLGDKFCGLPLNLLPKM